MSPPDGTSFPPNESSLPFRETLIDQAQLDDCDRIDLHFLGSIQGDTAHVAFISYPGCEIVATDAKFKQLSFMKHVDNNDPVVGSLIQDYFPQSIYEKVIQAVEDMSKASRLREFIFLWEQETFFSLCVTANSTQDYSLIGIEIKTLDEIEMLDLETTNESLSNTLGSVSRALDFCVDGQEAAKVACNAIFNILGHFDRGMVYYFHDDLSGEVIHEIKKDSLKSSYYGMHFPAADIPQTARLLYAKNVVRYIRNVDGEDVPIVSKLQAVDLTQTRSRSVHKCHLIYCRGMGIKSCMSLAIVSGGELWGLLSFHGYTTPFKPSLHQLIACETIASCVSARVISQAKDEQTTKMLLMGQLFRKWKPEANVVENFEALGDEILYLMDADVLAARHKNKRAVLSVPKGDRNLLPRGLFWDKLAEQIPTFDMAVKSTKKSIEEFGLAETNCLCSDFVYINAENEEIMIGRAQRERDVVWAGSPDAPKLNIGGMLHPRASFEAQLQKARKDPRPFKLLDQKLAGLLRDLVFCQDSMAWVLTLLDRNEVKDTIFRSFDTLETPDDENSAGCTITGTLIQIPRQYDYLYPMSATIEILSNLNSLRTNRYSFA